MDLNTLVALRSNRAALESDRSTVITKIDAIVDQASAENRSLRASETREFDRLKAEVKALDEQVRQTDDRIEEVRVGIDRQSAANEVRKLGGTTALTKVNEPDIYQRGGRHSYFRDLYVAARGSHDSSALDRLHRNSAYETEKRALGNTGAVGGSGGEFAPPGWFVDEWVNLIRAGRVTANLFEHEDVPAGISSINYPKLLTGTSVAIQTTQNTALSQTDATTSFVQCGFATLGGKQIASQQILDQGRNFDQVILKDLAAAYAQQVGTQVFTGTGTGTGTGAVVNGLGAATAGSTVAWTQASPTGAGFYGQTGALLSTFLTNRLMPPTCWVMHPRRWYWIESMVDANGRPYVVPNGPAYNQLATETNGPVAQGTVGTLHGLPVVLDPLVPINLGTGNNQDVVYLLKTDDLVLFESTPQVETFRETYADSLGVLFRAYGYIGTILNRHPESIGRLSGTGLVTPTFAS